MEGSSPTVPIPRTGRRRILQAIAAAPLLWGLPALAAEPDPSMRRRFEARGSVAGTHGRIDYRVVSGDTLLKGDDGITGSIFSFTYLREKPGGDAPRPVMFVFNGGPGASSVWLHLGAIGPRIVRPDRDVNPSVLPPYALQDNPDSILEVADLVFVDPIGTGFSRLRGVGKPADFYGVEEDARAMAQFIDLWLTEHDRWDSPKYVMGESYGSVRAAVLQRMLMGGPNYGGGLHAISLNGIVLVGSVMHAPGARDPDEAAMLLLPNLAATAWYHGKSDRVGRPLPGLVDEAIAFADGAYARALREGTRLSADGRVTVIGKLAALTGLSQESVRRTDLRITAETFATHLLEREGLDVGLYDSRYTLPHAALDVALDPVGDDPAMAQYTPLFAGAWHRYLARELNVRIADETYGTITWTGLSSVWRWDRTGVPGTQSYAVDLALAMRRNKGLKLLVASGYYDLATPMMVAETALARAEAPLDRIRFTRYGSGHMCYFGGTAATFLGDVRALIVGD